MTKLQFKSSTVFSIIKNNRVLSTFFVLIILAGILSILLLSFKNTSVITPVFIAVTITGLILQIRLYMNGGMIPKDGKRTIHSAIIFYSMVFAVILILSFRAYFFFTLE
jgi:hypothetical protein